MSAAIALGVGSLAAGLLNNYLGQSMSKDLMDYQYKLQQQAIDRMNLYNSPVRQMERLREAGLSPNLVYGNGVDGNQSSAASPSIANRNSQVGNPFQDAFTAYMQEKTLEMEQIKNRNEAFESRSRRLNLDARTMGQLLDNHLLSATMKDKVAQAAQRTLNMMAEEDNLRQRTNNLEIQANNLVEEGNLLAARTGLTQEQARTEIVRRKLTNKQLEHEGVKIRFTEKAIEKIAAEIPYIKSGKQLRDLAYKIQDTTYNSTGKSNQWLEEHPNIAIIVGLLEKALGLGGQAANIIP